MKSVISLTALLPLLAASSPLFSVGSIHNEAAPVLSSINAKEIPDSYIVVFKEHVSHGGAAAHHNWIQELHASSEASRADLRKRSQLPFLETSFNGLKHTYKIANGLLGYSGHFGDDVLEQIRRHPDVDYIEKDSEVHTMIDDISPAADADIEKNAPWGLARISHRDGLSFGTFNKYLYATDGGEGVDVYIIDTGTNVEHVDFEGRAEWLKTVPSNDPDVDGNGHGTHCSGTAVGKKYGVAKKAHVKAIKVLRSNGSGTMSDVVKGVEVAAEAHLAAIEAAKSGKGRKGFKGSTANMSLGGGKSPTLDKAVNAAVDVGIHFAVAAGNDNADACNYSPASADKAVTVAASTLADERAYFSNFGKCTDIFAPGLNILSTWIGSNYSTNTISGTSMASPHIAGLLAYLLSLQPAKDSAYAVADITPKQLKAQLIAVGTKGALSDVPSSTPNILAWNGGGSANYTDIVKKGGYTAKTTLESAHNDMEVLSKKIAQKVKAVSEEVEDFVTEELKSMMDELRNQ